MTQPKKPEKKQEIEYDPDNASWGNADDSYSHGSDVGEVYGFNQEIDEMEAYYKPILEEMAGALEDAVSGYKYIEMRYGKLDGVGWDRVYDKAEQALAKYKEFK